MWPVPAGLMRESSADSPDLIILKILFNVELGGKNYLINHA